MADKDTKVETKQAPAPAPNSGREPIPVKELRFRAGDSVDIPGKQGVHYIKTETHGAQGWVVEYHPWARSFCVTYTEESKPPRVVHIPESWGTWEAP